MVRPMPSTARSALASAIGWLIVAVIVVWMFGLLIGWIRFVLRSIAWIVLIVLLVAAYLAVREPPES